MTHHALRVLSYFAGPIVGYWGVWGARGLADRTASEEECRRGAFIAGFLCAIPLFIGVSGVSELSLVVIYVVYALLIAKGGATVRSLSRGERQVAAPSTTARVIRALIFPLIGFVLASFASVALQERNVAAQLSFAVFPIIQFLALARLAILRRRASHGYWTLLPTIGALAFILFVAIVGVPVR